MAFRLSHPGATTRPKHRHGRASASQKVTAALLAASMFFISGCGIGTQNPGSTSASSHSVVDEQTTKSELENLAQELKSNVSSDPKSLTGPSSAKNTPEVQPMVETPTPQLPVTFKDFKGDEVTVKSANRILALDLYGTLAQEVISLGLGDRLVGRVTSSTESSLAKLPLVTQNGHDLNADAILATNPDLVLWDKSNGPEEVVEQLRDAGVTVVVFDHERRMDKIIPQLKAVAQALGVQEAGDKVAERVQKDLDYALNTIKEIAPEGDKKLSMAFLYVRGNAGVFFILGKGSGADDLIAALEGRDVASEQGTRNIVPANSEALVKVNPDVILTMTHGVESTGGLDGFLARPGVAETNAGKSRRVVDMNDGQILSYGPNTPAVLLSLARAIYAPQR